MSKVEEFSAVPSLKLYLLMPQASAAFGAGHPEMWTSLFMGKQFAYALRQAEQGTPVGRGFTCRRGAKPGR